MLHRAAHQGLDLFGCDAESIKYVAPAREVLLRAARDCGATVIGDLFHQFEPYGVSGVVLIAESHFSLHTWPENEYAALDILTCGDMDAEVAIEIMKQGYGARTSRLRRLVRGQPDDEWHGTRSRP